MLLKRGSFFLGLGLLLVILSSCQPFVPTGDFIVYVINKTAANPYYNVGASTTYKINSQEAPVLNLVRGQTYTFGIDAPGHPFYLTTDPNGGPAGVSAELTTGVMGQQTEVGEMTFTPSASTPNLIYYQCAVHTDMGWKINITG